MLASALAATYDANLATCGGGADLVEEQALRWVADFVGFPLAEGAFTSGGMTSNLTALLAARERALPGARYDGVGARRAAVYCSDEAHHSVVRAVETCGLGSAAVRRIPLDGARRMRPGALADGAGARPSPPAWSPSRSSRPPGRRSPARSTRSTRSRTCAREHGVWLHVDGAYGLPAAAAPSAAPLFAGLERADSATVDAHKWLGVQKSCSVGAAARARPRSRPRSATRSATCSTTATSPTRSTARSSTRARCARCGSGWRSARTAPRSSAPGWRARSSNARRLAALVRRIPRLRAAARADALDRLLPPRTPGVADLDAPQPRALPRDAARRPDLPRARRVDGRACLRACFVNFRTHAGRGRARARRRLRARLRRGGAGGGQPPAPRVLSPCRGPGRRGGRRDRRRRLAVAVAAVPVTVAAMAVIVVVVAVAALAAAVA